MVKNCKYKVSLDISRSLLLPCYPTFLVQLNFQFPKEANKEMLDIGSLSGLLLNCKFYLCYRHSSNTTIHQIQEHNDEQKSYCIVYCNVGWMCISQIQIKINEQ